MKKDLLFSSALAALSACASEEIHSEPQFMDGTYDSDWAPLSADESFEGRSLAEWTMEYMRWRFSSTSCDTPLYDQDGSLCGLFQDPDSPVFFLDYSPTKRLRTKCRIPAGKAIFVPINSVCNDNVAVEPAMSDDELIEGARTVLDSMRDLKLRADGKSIKDITQREIEPTKFEYSLPPAPNWYACSGRPGFEDFTVSPAYLAGYAALFPSPKSGVHELQYAGVYSIKGQEYAIDTRTRITVED